MAENGRDENSSEGASQNQATQQNKQQQKDPKSQPEEITSSDDQPVVVNSHDYRGDPEEPFQDGSELSSPPPEDSFSSGGEQNSMDEGASLVPPPLIPPRGYLGYISPGPQHQMMLPMVALHSDSISPDIGPSSPPPPEQERRRVLLQQIEYYFSKDNLTSDKYLVSQMDGDHFVPISIVAAFNQVKKLTTDTDLIVDVIRESTMLQLSDDNDKVRAIPEKRCILILREIPKETPKESITALFQGKTCPNYVTCEFAYNDCWYVTFDTEEETQKAHAFLREEVREFLGQPIRARIKCTTVQRSSGVPKKRNTSYPPAMHSIYNGGPQLPGYYQQPNIVPWSHAGGAQYYDPGNYVQYMGNGFPPHQQQQQQQQQPAGTQQTPQQRYNGPQNRFSNVHNVYPAGRMDGERAGRGRGGSNEWHGRIDRGNSPPMANGDVPGERVRRGDHYSAGGGGGGAGGSRYRRDNEDTRKVPPRMTRNNRHPRIGGGSGAAGESVEKGDRTKRSQPAPRQQNKHQPKIEMGPTHFPPLPTSVESGITPSQPPTFTTSHTHTSNEEGKTVADIVKGKRTKDTVVNLQGPSLSSSNGGVAIQSPSLPPQTQQTPTSAIRNQTNTTKSSVNQPGATPLVNQQGQPPNTINTAPTGNSSSVTNSAALPNQQISVSTVSTAKVQTASQSVTSKPTPPSSSSVGVVNNGAPPTQTLSTVVSSGPQVVTSSSSSATQRQQRQQQSGTKIPVQENKASTNNHKSGTRYSDRENGSINRQNNGRNTQVHSKSDNRSTASINNRNRHREREKDTRRPGGLNSRSQQQQQQQQRPSPKTPKKQPPPLQAPPPPPTPTTPTPPTVTTNTATTSDNKTTLNVSNGDTSSTTTTAGSGGGGGAKSEKLSYAQMAQKKAPPVPPLPPKTNNTNNSNGSNSQGSSAPQGVATTTPSTSSSTSSSNNNASSTQGSSSLTPTTTTNQSQPLVRTTSAPTSPQGGPSSLGGVTRPNGTAFQSNVAGTVSKSTKSLPPNNVGGNSLAQHPTLTASKSAPPSPSKEGVATKGGATL